MSETPHCNASPLAHQPPPTPPCALAELVRAPPTLPPPTHPTPHPGTVGAVIFVAVAAALVGVGVAFGWVVAFISVKMKATKPPASAGGGQAQGGVTLSAPAQSTCENKV